MSDEADRVLGAVFRAHLEDPSISGQPREYLWGFLAGRGYLPERPSQEALDEAHERVREEFRKRREAGEEAS